ncbi:MAG: tRNA (guanosine(37)-N1)-methyltransferase TrmD [Lachnospiraceae bacterium]|nr:tRNA (guanosine(37)-N1)-methyltransferase TrmD [Lachnospiraceae bacterium]
MRFHVMTLFPEMVASGLEAGILGKAADKGLLSFHVVNIRDYTNEKKHLKVDDYTYGGGAGLLMQAQPIYDCYVDILKGIKKEAERRAANGLAAHAGIKKVRVIYVTPQAAVFTQKQAEHLAGEEELIFLCGHYEGVDERVLKKIVTDYISIGDYVLTGGELAAMVMIDAISRFVPGVLHNDESAQTDSLQNGLLEYPQYSRPEVWNGLEVPKVLLSGDHAKVEAWRFEQSLIRTKERRPELYEAYLAAHPEARIMEKGRTDSLSKRDGQRRRRGKTND